MPQAYSRRRTSKSNLKVGSAKTNKAEDRAISRVKRNDIAEMMRAKLERGASA